MRRALAISLMMLFSWTLIAPLLTLGAESNQSACCCCRNGKHRCMCKMHRMAQQVGNQKGFTTVSEKCPCCPASACTVYSPVYKPETEKRFYAEVVFNPARLPQSETQPRISFLRSHPKRGPPAPLI
jgi:tRNA G26 N,N-dimethylase Trm1